MDFDDFIAKYTPIKNHLLPHESLLDGYMFESLGPELGFVKLQNPLKIWTLIDAETCIDSNPDVPTPLYLTQGYHLTNSLGYVIASETYTEGNPDQYEC
jgi:hypothetical protein